MSALGLANQIFSEIFSPISIIFSTFSTIVTSACHQQDFGIIVIGTTVTAAQPVVDRDLHQLQHRHHHSCHRQQRFYHWFPPHPLPFELFSGAGEPPLTRLITQTTCPCRDLLFKTSLKLRHGRDRRQWPTLFWRHFCIFLAIFWLVTSQTSTTTTPYTLRPTLLTVAIGIVIDDFTYLDGFSIVFQPICCWTPSTPSPRRPLSTLLPSGIFPRQHQQPPSGPFACVCVHMPTANLCPPALFIPMIVSMSTECSPASWLGWVDFVRLGQLAPVDLVCLCQPFLACVRPFFNCF